MFFSNGWWVACRLWESLQHQWVPLTRSMESPQLPGHQARQSYANVCTLGQEEKNGKVSRAAAQNGHKQETFLFPLACWMPLRESRAPCWSMALPCQNRYSLQNPGEVTQSRWLCLEQSKQILYFWELPLRWSDYWSCGCWHTSSTNREKSVRTILIRDSDGSQKHVDDFFHVLMPLATSGIKRGEYQ